MQTQETPAVETETATAPRKCKAMTQHNFSIAALCSKESDGRYPVHNLLVTPDETVATDLFQLIRVTTVEIDSTGYPDAALKAFNGAGIAQQWAPFLMDRKQALEAAKAVPKETIPILNHAFVSGDGKLLGMTDLENERTFQVPEPNGSRFPAFETIIPAKDKAEHVIAFDAALLARVFQQVSKLAADGRAGVAYCEVRFYGTDHGIRIDAETDAGQQITALVMPYRLKE